MIPPMPGLNFAVVAQSLQLYLKRRALVFLLSDFLTEKTQDDLEPVLED